MSSGPFQSESLRQVQAGADARMVHVLQALEIGEKATAKDLFARVSKTMLAKTIDNARRTERERFPEVHRITAEEVNLDRVESLFISRRTLWIRPEAASASRLELAAQQLADEITSSFLSAKTRVFLVDALLTQIGDRDEGFTSFDLKQKYVLA